MGLTDELASHLLQMRGLKLYGRYEIFRCFLSHLLQMRGLKLFSEDRAKEMVSRIFYRCVD